ncbi:hypothetical protein, partial [uncultured Rikenella sp.]|uniref:hypothetical protein n=1 Tax=uncultured Rikenella sp. TaxID=368003 RepID=UPI0026329A3D
MENNTLDRWLSCRPAETGGVGVMALAKVPVLPYPAFAADMRALLLDADGSPSEGNRCVAYFAVPDASGGGLVFYALVARDKQGDVVAASHA